MTQHIDALHELQLFYDGAIPPAKRRAAMAADMQIAAGIARTNELLRHCRVGRMVDRRPTAERMAEAMARCYRRRGVCRYADLLAAGFTRAEIRQHGAAARGRAARLVVRHREAM